MTYPVHVEDGGRTHITHLSYPLNGSFIGDGYWEEKNNNIAFILPPVRRRLIAQLNNKENFDVTLANQHKHL